MVVRKDVYGKYLNPGRKKQTSRKDVVTETGEATDEILKAHFTGETLIGLFTTNDAGQCREAVIDIDRHADDDYAEVNEAAAVLLSRRALDRGASVILEDSNGRGGFKVRLIFRSLVPAAWVRNYLRSLIKDWQGLGLIAEPEIFPKQDKLAPGKVGNFVRLPGRHHKHDFWSRIWDGKEWLTGEAAAQQIVSTVGTTAEMIPMEFRTEAMSPPSPHVAKSKLKANPSSSLIGLIRSAIKSLPQDYPGSYQKCVEAGMSLKDLGDVGLELWEEICRRCPRHRDGFCQEKWATFSPGGGRTYKTILDFAIKNGWQPPKRGGSKSAAGLSTSAAKEKVVSVAATDDSKSPSKNLTSNGDSNGPVGAGNSSSTGSKPPDANKLPTSGPDWMDGLPAIL